MAKFTELLFRINNPTHQSLFEGADRYNKMNSENDMHCLDCKWSGPEKHVEKGKCPNCDSDHISEHPYIHESADPELCYEGGGCKDPDTFKKTLKVSGFNHYDNDSHIQMFRNKQGEQIHVSAAHPYHEWSHYDNSKERKEIKNGVGAQSLEAHLED